MGALIRLRCGNLEEANKYWKKREEWECRFCRRGKDNMEHFMEECRVVKSWFEKLGGNMEERWNRIWNDELDEVKGKILRRIWKENEKWRGIMRGED